MACSAAVMAVVVLLAGAQSGTGDIALEYRQLHENTEEGLLPDHAHVSRDSIEHGIVRFGVERDGGFPYSFVVSADGKCEYYGDRGFWVAYVRDDPCSAGPRAYTGRISPSAYKQVAEFILDSGFHALEDAYESGLTDVTSTYTLVETSNGTKIVRNCGGAGPSELATIERMIRGMVFEVSWDPLGDR